MCGKGLKQSSFSFSSNLPLVEVETQTKIMKKCVEVLHIQTKTTRMSNCRTTVQ